MCYIYVYVCVYIYIYILCVCILQFTQICIEHIYIYIYIYIHILIVVHASRCNEAALPRRPPGDVRRGAPGPPVRRVQAGAHASDNEDVYKMCKCRKSRSNALSNSCMRHSKCVKAGADASTSNEHISE